MDYKPKGGGRMDHKIKVILSLVFVILVLFAYVGATAYTRQKNIVYTQGLQDGALLQQQNVIRSIQATGYYAINVVDQSGQQTSLILRPVQPTTQPQQS